MFEFDSLNYLRLLQLSDSALPIGTAAHSFGLEMLVADGVLRVAGLETFLHGYLTESGLLESVFGRAAYRLGYASPNFESGWQNLNERLSAFKTGREAREASASLGRRFLQLALNLGEWPGLYQAGQISQLTGCETHLCTAFGLVGSLLTIGEDVTLLAYLHQAVAGLISACQRLLPLGQSQASRILWNLKPFIIETMLSSREVGIDSPNLSCFTPLLDLGVMRHPKLTTRLFIS